MSHWIDRHFPSSPQLVAQQRAQAVRAHRRGVAAGTLIACAYVGAALLVGAGGWATAEHYRWIDSGYFPQPWKSAKPVAATHVTEAPVVANSPAAIAISEPAEARPVPAPPSSAAQPAPAALATVATVNQRQLHEHIRHLDSGLDLLTRDRADVDRQIAAQQILLVIRPVGERTKPWHPTEQLDYLRQYRRDHPQLSGKDEWDLNELFQRANADLGAVNTRIAELAAKRASLTTRLDAAAAERAGELAQLQAP